MVIMKTLQDCKKFAQKELERTKDGSDDALRDFEALRIICQWILEA